MQWYRIWAVVRRHLILQTRDLNRLFDVTLWPFLDTFIGFFVSIWIARSGMAASSSFPLFGILFWTIMMRANMDSSICVLEEIWNKNLSNILSSPLQYHEWIIALLLNGLIRAGMVVVACAATLWFMYDISTFIFGWWLPVLFVILVISGWAIGCFCAALVLRYGNRVTAIVFSTWSLLPFCGVFYPFDILPPWMQIIGNLLPMTHVFYAVQVYLMQQVMPLNALVIAAAQGLLYLVVGIIVCKIMFERSRARGFAAIEAE